VVIKSKPLPHDCGRILDINWISNTRVNYNCSLCGELIAWSDIEQRSMKVQIEIDVTDLPLKRKKVYPKPDEAQYNPLNCEMWK
jgi:hypothetical protein